MRTRQRSVAVYVYGIVRESFDLGLGSVGIDEHGAPAPIYRLPVGRVAAVVSARREKGSALPIRRNLDAHHRVIAQAMERGPILPFAFGQLAKSERQVLSLLRSYEPLAASELDRLEGKVQMGLKLQWDVENLFQYIVGGEEELVDLRDRLFSTADPPSLAERIELGRLFEERLKMRRAALVDSLLATLLGEACACRRLPVRDEKAVADLAFLVERSRRQQFEELVRCLAEGWPSEFVFCLTGPWAPFNFVELQYSASDAAGVDEDEVEWAS